MKELESLLSDIPLEEREEALNYYNGYIEDAGKEHEEDILKELGSPGKVAGIIKADLNLNAQDRVSSGYFTEKGYEDTTFTEDKYQVMGAKSQSQSRDNTGTNQQQNNYNQSANRENASEGSKAQSYWKRSDTGMKIGIIILICIFGFPFIISAFGVFVGVVSAIIGIVIGFGAAGIAMIVTGFSLFVTGLTELTIPFFGLLLCGAGLLILGLGMLFMSFTIFLCKSVLPAIFKGIIQVCRMPFQNRSVMV